ncbi:hypothetical protein BS297_00800 [Rhodococcus erythropolis]|uniref:Uncharacterized protein n=1 Tax=Rhodococcus erythropolis TaxID=1833 RepID=A0A5N5EE45_RHOER|nr:hypothetical protein BS297_00800 [Rhodococcus erythropolis]
MNSNSETTNVDDDLRQIIRIAINTAQGDSVHRPDPELAEAAAFEKIKKYGKMREVEGKLHTIDKLLDIAYRHEKETFTLHEVESYQKGQLRRAKELFPKPAVRKDNPRPKEVI